LLHIFDIGAKKNVNLAKVYFYFIHHHSSENEMSGEWRQKVQAFEIKVHEFYTINPNKLTKLEFN